MGTQRSRLVILIPAFWILCALVASSLISAQEGTLEWKNITSPALAGNLIGDPETRSFAIYLPPSYKTSEERYPVFYVLHGYMGNIGSMTPIKPTIDFMIRNRNIGEMIAVFVDGSNKFRGSWYLSSETIGNYETYITQDLVNHIDANYRTIVNRESRGITGFSMGGYGAMHLALKFPQVFSAVVSQGGVYDFDSAWWKNPAQGTARVNPKDWAGFGQMFWLTQCAFAVSAAVSPNPDKPPFFLDKAFELVDKKLQVVPETWKQHVDADIVHGDLPSYLKQPMRLSGILFVHGTSDGIVPISQAQTLDKAMTDLGVDYVYEEHGGGHNFLAEKSFQFLSNHLEGDELLEEGFAVYARDKLAVTWGEIKQCW
ncbi:prolyl oligopeptidase family serine peptidase [bacterium]|nr:prolyl oligopeptidase family serine peptidase [bacterium]